MYSDLFFWAKTRDEADILISELNDLKESLFKEGAGNFEEILLKKVRGGVAAVIRREFEKEIDRKGYLEGALKALSKLPVLRITLAFEPTEEIVNMIYDWVENNLGKAVILEILRRQSIVGGAIVEYNGKYKDLSLKSKLEQLISK